jgi:hypothetical protein
MVLAAASVVVGYGVGYFVGTAPQTELQLYASYPPSCTNPGNVLPITEDIVNAASAMRNQYTYRDQFFPCVKEMAVETGTEMFVERLFEAFRYFGTKCPGFGRKPPACTGTRVINGSARESPCEKGSNNYMENTPGVMRTANGSIHVVEQCNGLSNLAFTGQALLIHRLQSTLAPLGPTATADLRDAAMVQAAGSMMFHSSGSIFGPYSREFDSRQPPELRIPASWTAEGADPNDLLGYKDQTFSGCLKGNVGYLGDVAITFDMLPNSLISQVAMQAALKPWYDKGYIPKALYLNDRNKTGSEVMAEVRRFVVHEQISDWGPFLSKTQAEAADFPSNLELITTAVIALAVPPAFQDHVALPVLKTIGKVLGCPDSDFVEKISPMAKALYLAQEKEHVSISWHDRFELATRGLGVLVHFAWSFVWQEEIFRGVNVVDEVTQSQGANFLAGVFMRPINAVLNNLQGPYGTLVTEALPSFQNDADQQYPGGKKCSRSFSAHSKFHAVAANALVRLWLLAVDVRRIIEKEGLTPGPSTSMYESVVSSFAEAGMDEEVL